MRRVLTNCKRRVSGVVVCLVLIACSSSEPEESRLEKACRADYVAQAECGPVEVEETEYVAGCQESEPETVELLECRAHELAKDCDVDRVGEVCDRDGD